MTEKIHYTYKSKDTQEFLGRSKTRAAKTKIQVGAGLVVGEDFLVLVSYSYLFVWVFLAAMSR